MNRAVEAYKAAGEATRLRILKLLQQAPGELCVCEVVDTLQKPQYTVSKCLTILRNAQLVEERREGKFMMYKLHLSPFNDKLFESFARLANLDPIYEVDSTRLRERLALRHSGNCEAIYR